MKLLALAEFAGGAAAGYVAALMIHVVFGHVVVTLSVSTIAP